MLRLCCAVVGVAVEAFDVDVDENKTIGRLKRVIKEAKKDGLEKFDACDLQLYRAMKSDECIIKGVKTKGSDLNKPKVPVCSGMFGLGKTRMLEEGRRILCEEMNLDPRYVTSVIVPYWDSLSPEEAEESMPIQASFSWRLLYRFFLIDNCSNAVEVIELKLRNMGGLNGAECVYLFLGIDDYQRIDNVSPNQSISPLHELMSVIGEFLSEKLSVILLPIFAGRELRSIAAFSSCHYQVRQLPMTLLTMDQVLQLVESQDECSGLLTRTEFLRYMFFLGGVPRWIAVYLTEIKKKLLKSAKALEIIDECYEEIKRNYVRRYFRFRKWVRLAAYAVSGTAIKENSLFEGNVKWSSLQDSSLCLLLQRMHEDEYDVRVPYTLLAWTGAKAYRGTTSAENDFADALRDLYDRVDSVLFDVQPWQQWAEFGACFYAMRINAFLLLGRSTVSLGELPPGAKMTVETSRISVNLVPSRVVQTEDQYGASIIPNISCLDENEKIDWTSGGWIVLNGDNGAGVDIFFALTEAETNNLIVFVDQRKRHNGPFYPSHAKKCFKQLDILPDFLKDLGIYEMDHDCFLLPREENEKFHGTLAYHPACSPVVDVNSASLTALRSVLKGSKEAVDEAIEVILTKRNKPSGGFSNFEAFNSQVLKKLKVGIEENARIAP